MENPQVEVTIISAHTLTEDLEWRAGRTLIWAMERDLLKFNTDLYLKELKYKLA